MSNPPTSESHDVRPQWRSRTGFILAALGSAVGLGNIWRFSYVCYKNGGGAFLIPYGLALLIVGIPLMILEFGIGHKMRGSAPLSLAKASPNWEWLGWWSVICAMYGIMLYYSTVIAWCLSYVFFSTNLKWGADPNHFFFNEFLQLSEGPAILGNFRSPIILSVAIVWAISWLICFKGVQKGLERANKIFMPLLFVLILILVVWSVNLEGAAAGLKEYLQPDFSQLSNKQIWLDAFSQIFFTLSLGFGIMITYASYLPTKVNIVKDACIVSIGNCVFSFITGFAVFGTLGYMAHTTGKPISEVVDKAIGLCFVTYPKAISLFPDVASNVFGILFFTTLVIAGLSSAVSLVEAFSSAVIDKFRYSRKNVVSVVCITGFLGSILFTSQGGLHWLDIVDHFINAYGLVVGGILECILIGWIVKSQVLRKHINQAGDINMTKVWDVCVRFVTPVILILLVFNSFSDEIREPYGDYSWVSVIMIGWGWLIIALIAAFFVVMRPWKKNIKDF